MILSLLLACGVQEALMQPNPPPGPAPGSTMADADEVTISGVVSAISGETRSWVQVGDGQTVIGHLPATGVLTIDTRTSLPSDLQLGMFITTHGHQQGDLVVVIEATAQTDVAASTSPTAPLDPAAPVAPAAPAPAAPTPAPAAPTPAPATPG